MLQLDSFIAVLIILLIAISLHYILLRRRRAQYEKGLKERHNETCCFYFNWPLLYSAPIIRHTFYEEFIVINGRGENERIEYKNIVKATIAPIHKFSWYFLKYSIEYDYLNLETKERRSVILSTRYPEKIMDILNSENVDINNKTQSII